MAVETPICDFGWHAPDFTLPGIDGRSWSLEQVRGPNGVVVMFLCNHCPYVKAVIDRVVADMRVLQGLGVGAVAIMANDTVAYPEDSFDNMKTFAAQHGFSFPYVLDQTQAVARAYDAVCTPDFFGFDAGLGLQYRGRLDASGRAPGPTDCKRDLLDAMRAIAAGGRGPAQQIPSMGCSIKWKAD